MQAARQVTRAVQRRSSPRQTHSLQRHFGSTLPLDGRVILVTGGAKGIGEGCAVQCAQAGARVVVADLDSQAGGLLAEEVAGSFVQMDAAAA